MRFVRWNKTFRKTLNSTAIGLDYRSRVQNAEGNRVSELAMEEKLSATATTLVHLMLWAPLLGVSVLLIREAIRENRPVRNRRRRWWQR